MKDSTREILESVFDGCLAGLLATGIYYVGKHREKQDVLRVIRNLKEKSEK